MPDHPDLDTLNHQQLRYFWTAVREGGVARAAEVLHLSKATVSGQIKKLEQSLGHQLWHQRGRRMQLTPTGSVVYEYAERIFALSAELLTSLAGEPASATRLRVGIAHGVPQLLAYRFIRLAIGEERCALSCLQDDFDEMLDQLDRSRLDVVLADSPAPPNHPADGHNHLIDQSPVALFGLPRLAARFRDRDPAALTGAPVLMPMAGTELRRSFNRWLEEHGVEVQAVGEFANTALLKIFGAGGLGLFPAPLSVADHIQTAFGCIPCVELDGCREYCYAITDLPRPRHPLVLRLLRSAALRT